MSEEYYIRGPEEETASGPFSLDALITLAEAGKVTPEHYYFDPKMESWALIRSNEPLFKQIYPEKKQLTLKRRTEEEILIAAEGGDNDNPAVKVEEMLAAAEGHTKETKHVRTKKLWEERTAAISVPLIGTMLLVSALSVLYPSWSIIQGILNETEGAYLALFQKPVVLLGALDLLMGAFLLLNATEIFPMIRFRAMLGAGFFAVLYAASWLNGDPVAIWLCISSLGFGIGLFISTLTLNFNLMILSAIAGFGGLAGIIWYGNLVPLLLGS